MVGDMSFDPLRTVVMRAGQHLGRRFRDGSVTASRTIRLTSSTTMRANARAVINGAWRLHLSGGPLNGYWVVESSAAFLPGAVQLMDLWAGRAALKDGTRTGYRYNTSGKVLAARTSTLNSPGAASVAGWAIINGRASFYMTAGRWAAHWLPESSGVHVP
jgi:hypothetical protein